MVSGTLSGITCKNKVVFMNRIDNLLLCVGAQKSGTTWLYEVLKNSSDIEFGVIKEVHYFDYKSGITNQLPNMILNKLSNNFFCTKEKVLHDFFDGESDFLNRCERLIDGDWYIDQFRSLKTYSADFTPEYALLDSLGFSHIKELSKNQKIIYIMREPVSRSISALKYFHKNRGRKINEVNIEKLKKQAESNLIISRSQYGKTIRNLKKNFDSDNILFLFFEEVMNDKKGNVKKIGDFLNVDLDWNESLSGRVNSSSDERVPDVVKDIISKKLSNVIGEVKEEIGYVPSEWMSSKANV